MQPKKYREEQIIQVLKEGEAGACFRHTESRPVLRETADILLTT